MGSPWGVIMSYQDITLEEMDQFLRKRRFYPVDLYFRRRPVKEWVYERKLPRHANHFVRVYTSIQRYGRNSDTARDVGKDAIRVQVIYRDNKGETLVSFPKRVNRVTTWATNLDDRLQEIASTLPEVKRDSRGEPMTLRKKKGNLFWGSRDYPAYKETRRYGSEEQWQGNEIEVIMLFDLLTNNGLALEGHQGILTDYEPLDIMKSTTEYLTSTGGSSGPLVKEYLIKLEDDMNQAVGWEEMAESCLEQIHYVKLQEMRTQVGTRFRVFPNLLSRGIVEESDATRLINGLESQLRDILLLDRIEALQKGRQSTFDAINFVNI